MLRARKVFKSVRFFLESDPSKHWDVEVKLGDNILQLCEEHKIPLIGACEGSGKCATCHCKVRSGGDLFDEPSDIEYDGLDMAFDPDLDSRLGCMLNINEAVLSSDQPIEIEIPEVNRNIAVDGYKPPHH